MNLGTLLILVVVGSVLATRLLGRVDRHGLLISGVEFLALGVVLGPMVSGAITEANLRALQPLVSLLIGLLGFGLGLMLRGNMGTPHTIPARIMSAITAAAIVGCGSFAVLVPTLEPSALQEPLWIAATLAAIAAIASPTLIAAGAAALRADGPVTRTLQAFSIVHVLLSVAMFGLISAAMRAHVQVLEELSRLSPVEWLVESILVGAACGILFVAFIGNERAPSRIFLATVGCVIFASGMAAGLGVSPLFVNLVVGATVGGLSPHAVRLQKVVHRLEHPTYVLLLIFAGAFWTPGAWWVWAFVPVYLGLRLLSLRVGVGFGSTLLEERLPITGLGNGLFSQGPFAVAIALNFAQLRPEHGPLMLTTVLLSVLAQNFFAGRSLRTVLADAQEVYTLIPNKDDQPSAQTGLVHENPAPQPLLQGEKDPCGS